MDEKQMSIIEARNMCNYNVAKANEFIWNSMYCLNLTEQRLLACAISMVDSRPSDLRGDNEVSMVCEFGIDTFCRICNMNRRASITYIKDTLIKLASLTFGMEREDGGWETFSFVDKASISPDKKTITIKLHDDMKPYLLNLDSHFTSYKLPMILNFKSKHSNNIFDLIYSKYCEKNYPSRAGSFQMSIDDLKSRVAIKINQKNKMIKQDITFKDFRINMLEPAIADINEFTDIIVSVDYIKRGKKVEMVEFHYKPRNLTFCLDCDKE